MVWFPKFNLRASSRVLAGGGLALGSALVLALLSWPEPGAERVRGRAHHRKRIAVPASNDFLRVGTVDLWPATGHAQTLPKADILRLLVVAVITDTHAPTAVRNACHRLIGAIQTNSQALVEDALVDLEHTAARKGYPLPSRESAHTPVV
jgi:hypothetical protein